MNDSSAFVRDKRHGRQLSIDPHLLHLTLEHIGRSSGGLLLLQLNKQLFVRSAVLLGLCDL